MATRGGRVSSLTIAFAVALVVGCDSSHTDPVQVANADADAGTADAKAHDAAPDACRYPEVCGSADSSYHNPPGTLDMSRVGRPCKTEHDCNPTENCIDYSRAVPDLTTMYCVGYNDGCEVLTCSAGSCEIEDDHAQCYR